MKLLTLLTILATTVTSQVIFNHDSPSCPIIPPISCARDPGTSNSCCFENPAGVIELTQFWDYNPTTGPDDLFTLHGLWNYRCSANSGYPQFCDPSLEIDSNGNTIEDIIVNQFNDQELFDNLKRVWADINGRETRFWAHEWNKHGTCFSTLKPGCFLDFKKNENVYKFFSLAYKAFEKLDTFSWLVEAGIKPSTTETYTLGQIQDALDSKFGKNVYIKCDRNHAINEIWYYHHVKGSLLQGDFLPIDSFSQSNCPQTGIKFPPKGTIPQPNPRPTTTHADGPAPTGDVPARSYISLTGKPGCLISNGNWFTRGTCATYRFQDAPYGGVEIRSSKGNCGVVDGRFICNRSIDASKQQFSVKDGKIGYGGNSKWCLGQKYGLQTSVVLADDTCESFELVVS
ncbi:RNY1-A Ribonuclease T2-like 1-A [Candida maltosa Xu316]|uniref:ribonuclease T2 n=1 Tax=Candida maltosa (strain Xu316) TaxID=1245528 RepID=M3HH02_CANMX|nr:Ribonuclease T2-like 1-A [Candida maltosa Xu316]